MKVDFGKFHGKTIELLVLKEPDYIDWFLRDIGDKKPHINAEIMRLLRRFDQKEFSEKCMGRRCTAIATKMTAYQSNLTPHWWCDDCNPYQTGALDGKLSHIKTYKDALQHVWFYCKGNKKDAKRLVLNLARGKGLPARVGETAATKFFE